MKIVTISQGSLNAYYLTPLNAGYSYSVVGAFNKIFRNRKTFVLYVGKLLGQILILHRKEVIYENYF